MSVTASVLIEGNYVDAYLYGGLLLAWDDRGRLLIASTESLAAAAALASKTNKRIARALFVDNKVLKEGEALAQARKSPLASGRDHDDALHLSMDKLDPRYFEVATDAHVLDLMATYGRMFVSTDDALLSFPFAATEVGAAQTRLPHRCLSTTPRWGAVSASCAEVGAWALLYEVEKAHGATPRAVQLDASRASIRHSWLGASLLSFDDENRIEAFKARVPREKGQRRLAEGFSASDEYLTSADAYSQTVDERAESINTIDFITAFPGLVVIARAGVVVAQRVHLWEGAPMSFDQPIEFAEVDKRVLSVADTDAGFVVETVDALLYVEADASTAITNRETIALRAYPRSKRHRRTVTATVDGGLLITALLGTHPLPRDERHFLPA
jgi:hypothetical protein